MGSSYFFWLQLCPPVGGIRAIITRPYRLCDSKAQRHSMNARNRAFCCTYAETALYRDLENDYFSRFAPAPSERLY